ncbi:LPXTG cell wall anchor domain-containing protein [Enterococcus durans]|nr:LPXTG cell wall anchor domain-containing protein [Enterococcus durans]MBE9886352.1 LPXTG cell wall anchor domain-containing protein [Enterococcus durans]
MTYPQTGETTGNQALLFIGFALILARLPGISGSL